MKRQPGENYPLNSLILENPLKSFRYLPSDGSVKSTVTFSGEQIKEIPSGGHYQGIQYFVTNESHYLFISHDSGEKYPYLVIAERISEYSWAVKKIFIIKYDEEGLSAPLRHAGGFQICSNCLAVGIEDNAGKKESRVIFYDITDPLKPMLLPELTINRSSEKAREKTAGAVAFISFKKEAVAGYITAVANWDAKDIDFYFFPGNLKEHNSGKFKTEAFFSWKSRNVDRSYWEPDKKWGSYQSINFIKDKNDNLYLMGTANSGKILGLDYIDLFQVVIGEDSYVEITKINKKIVYPGIYHPLSKRPHFIYGGGIFVSDYDNLYSLATARNIREKKLKIRITGS